MKNVLRTLLLLVIVSSFNVGDAKASHIAAADVYYEYLSPLNYRVHLILYRDCGGVNLGPTAFMTAIDSSCNQTSISFTVDTTGTNDPWNGTARHGICQNLVSANPCQNPPAQFDVYQYWHYAADVTLPYACSDWRFRWTSCCRNPNSTGPTASTCVYALLNNTVRPNNSTVLTAEPIPYICLNQPYQYLNSPVDPDLDSVVFRATTAGNNQSQFSCTPYLPTAYNAPMTPLNPVLTTPATPASYIVDPTTGTVAFTPTTPGQYILAFTATEYDYVTQQRVGVVQRDVQVTVVGCTTFPPSIQQGGPSSSAIQNLTGAVQLATAPTVVLGVCPGETMSFDAVATGDTLNNLIKTFANNAVSAPGATYISTPLAGGNPVTGSFTWTPPASQIGDHTLIITFVDSTCLNGQPIILRSYLVVLIKVLRGVSAGPDLPICAVGDSIIIPALGPEDVTNWTWTEMGNSGQPHGMGNPNVQNPFVRPDRTTTYIVTTNAQTACKNSDTITVFIDTSVTVAGNASPAILCEPGITSLSATPAGPPPTYNCGTEGIGCAAPSSMFPFGATASSSFNVTPFLGSNNGGRCQLIFTQAELAAAGWNGPRRIDSLSFDVINKTSFGEFNMEINMGCTYVSDINNFIPSGLTKKVYENANYQTTLGTNTFHFQTPYIWDGVQNLVVDVCFFNLNPVGIDEVASTSTAPNNQYIGATSPFGGCQIPDAPGSTLPTISLNRPNVEFYACDLPATPWQYQWSGPYVFDSTLQNAQAYINSNPSKYVVYTTGGNGCLVWDTVEVSLSNHDVNVTPEQETICLNDRVRAVATGIGETVGETFLWFPDANSSASDLSCTNCATPEITPTTPGPHVYTVVRTDSYGCVDTTSITINVRALPNVVITNGDTVVVRYGEELQLLSEGAIRYSWSPSWGMTNPNISSPAIKPSETALYTVNGLDEFGCGNKDEIYVIVDYSHNLFIPTAFSPNGDGNNDIFRIANFGYQRVSEFRVYNRWGQEVYSARDNNGWNGTFRGEDQDNGTYHYIIKAAFADGHVQTFKGDVILMR
jgi:gliding motility-associated-like protein